VTTGRTPWFLAVVLVAAVGTAVTSCSGKPAPEPTSVRRTTASTLVVCELRFRPPPGFAQRGTFTVRESDHVGKRLSYTDGQGRRLVFASGITGEFAEGEPVAGTLSITTGERARLLGRDSAWFLVWSGTAPCVTRAVLGHGLGRAEFVRLLKRSGVVAPES
jgi:hypothetical protein